MHCLTRVFFALFPFSCYLSLSQPSPRRTPLNRLVSMQVLYTTLNANRDAIVISDDVLRIQYVNIAAELLLHIKVVSRLDGSYGKQNWLGFLIIWLFYYFVFLFYFIFVFLLFFFHFYNIVLGIFIPLSLSYVSFLFSVFSIYIIYLLSPSTLHNSCISNCPVDKSCTFNVLSSFI